MKDDNVKVRGGIGFFGILTILFIALKLLDKIQWPWVWVLAPLWVPWTIVIVVLVIVAIIGALMERR